MTKFAYPHHELAAEVQGDHGGTGPILFQRVLQGGEFASAVDFVDYTIVPPGSTIGKHEHHGNEELYYIASGTPMVRVNGEQARLQAGALSIVRSGEWHELVNDTDHNVTILVIQVSLR